MQTMGSIGDAGDAFTAVDVCGTSNNPTDPLLTRGGREWMPAWASGCGKKKTQKSPRVEREREVVEMNMHNKWTAKAPETVEVRTSVSRGEKRSKIYACSAEKTG